MAGTKTAAGAAWPAENLVLGIDPGLAETGYAVLQLEPSGDQRPGPTLVEAGLIRTAAQTPLPRRLDKIFVSLTEILRQHPAAWVAVEDLYSNYRHPGTALLMAHARGVILLAAGQAGAAVTSFPPTRVKQAITGRGHASKEQVQHMVQTYLGLKEPPRPDHVADALAVALAFSHLQQVSPAVSGGP